MSVYNSKFTGAQIESRLDEIDSFPIKLTPQTLTAGATTLTFSNAAITTNSTIVPYTNVWGISPKTITVATGSVTLTFDPQASAINVYIEVK